jgi:hypothetical protein
VTAFSRLHPAWRAAVVLWAAVVLGVFGRVTFAPVRSGSVVPVYLHAAVAWGDRTDLYDSAGQPDQYRNPPGYAAAFVPFTWIHPRAAALLWRSLGLAVFLTGLATWTRHGLQLTTARSGTVFALAAPLVLPSLNNGQVNVLLIGLMLHGMTTAIRGRGIVAGVCLAAATAIKVYPAAVGLLASVVFPPRVLPSFVLATAGFLALPFLMAPPDYVAEQYRKFVENCREDDRHVTGQQVPPRDFFWLLRAYTPNPSIGAYRLAVLALAGGMAVLVAVVARRNPDRRIAAVLALDLGCVWMTVFGPATEAATYTLLAPTAAAAVVLAWSPGSRLRFSVALLGYLLLISPIVRDFFPHGRAFHDLGPQPLGGLLIFAAVRPRSEAAKNAKSATSDTYAPGVLEAA